MFGNIERMGNDRIAISVYVGECVGSHLVGRIQKRLIASVNKEKRFECWQARSMVYDRNEWREFVRGNSWSMTRGMTL